MSPKVFAITQRLSYIAEYGEERESLDTEWYTFFSQVGDSILLPIAHLHDPTVFLSEFDVDGVVLSGGNDVCLNDELDNHPAVSLSAKRDAFEKKMILAALQRGIPILGVCRGMQIITLHLGGKIKPITRHVCHPHGLVRASSCDLSSSLARSIIKCFSEGTSEGLHGSVTVNSFHNFGVNVDSNFHDGVEVLFLAPEEDSIECLLHAGKQMLGIMWHPERSDDLARRRDINIVRQLFWSCSDPIVNESTYLMCKNPVGCAEVIILCAGQGTRLRPLTDSVPKCMVKYRGRSLIDYILSSLSSCGLNNIILVTGYKSEQLVRPDVNYIHNPRYLETNMVGSLFCALEAKEYTSDLVVSYSDIIYKPFVVQKLIQAKGADISVVIDKDWLKLWKSRMADPLSDAETLRLDRDGFISEIGKVPNGYEDIEGQYIGLIKFSPVGLRELKMLYYGLDRSVLYDAKDFNNMYMTTILQLLIDSGVKVSPVFIHGGWIEVDSPEDLLVNFDTSDIPDDYHGQSLNFGTKAVTLARLRNFPEFGVLPLEYCTREEWQQDNNFKEAFIMKCQKLVSPTNFLIVRSSAAGEDSHHSSSAGVNDSVLNVTIDADRIITAVDKVFSSYSHQNEHDHVLVQPMLRDVRVSGVICTTELQHYMPYFVLSFEESGATDGVTSGTTNSFQTVYTMKEGRESYEENMEWKRHLYELVKMLEVLFANDKLDIEFAVNGVGQIHILQVRPVVLPSHSTQNLLDAFPRVVKHTEEHLEQIFSVREVLDNMMDWNPAEMIGLSPSPLAISLYELLITDDVAMNSRALLGYRDVSQEPLMVNISGRCFVRARVCFGSLIPASVDEALASKLLGYYLDRLISSPESRDKVEFEIAFTCFDLDLKQRLGRLDEFGFTAQEQNLIHGSLLDLTNYLFERIDDDLSTVELLPAKLNLIKNERKPHVRSICDIVACTKQFGTLPFSNLARSAFVSVSILRSLVRIGVLHDAEVEIFMESLQTVSKELSRDARQLQSGRMTQESFLSKYGHLRPGTYDICASRYDEDFELYFPSLCRTRGYEASDAPKVIKEASNVKFTISEERQTSITALLKSLGMSVDFPELISFCRKSIEGRERAKFIFTMSVSHILATVSDMGANFGIHRYDLSFLNLKDVLKPHQGHASLSADHIRVLRQQHQELLTVKLPSTIFKAADIFEHFELFSRANFVTKNAVCAATVHEASIFSTDLQGKIIVVPSADPGWDWLFSNDIAGLITCFGGANSHMAIRAAELSLPAAIGIGEKKFREIMDAGSLQLNCDSEQIIKIKANLHSI